MTQEQPDLFSTIGPHKEEKAVYEPPQEYLIQEAARPPAAANETDEFMLPGAKKDPTWPEAGKLAELHSIAGNCELCRLRSTCNQVVFGEGPEDSRLMLIGEGPGQDEDLQGRPFVGRAGQLLDKILQAAEIERTDVYITNVVKCRPPQNRLPDVEEVKACKGCLEAQVRLIKPGIIVCLGALATQTVVDPRARISKVRGIWLTRAGIKIMPTFHPAAVLRNPEYKRPVWEDFKLIRDEYKKIQGR
ncbi:MAG TPA: uracil-DNA glycosylase [Syntrophomonadaceae bacterium]|nr:uracil-DNA glycosylase [Syntrophomonadaceae bacterium]HPR92936.1 uracil-DNA glycosylase [Syntrophomonadaceae bacterium]